MNAASYRIVIPARLASERLPGKPLRLLAGKSLLERVFDCARRARAESIVVATDAEEVAAEARRIGATAVMTSASHASGSDRIAECADRLGWDDDTLVVNLQGDEPLMPPECLDQVATLLSVHAEADAASLYWPIDSADEIADPNVVKVVVDGDGFALYFSRSPVPYARIEGGTAAAVRSGMRWKRHIGLYAYRAGALRAFAAAKPTPLETLERLEQLRLLESGRRIAMAQAARPIPAGVDTPEDLERVSRILAASG